MQFLFRAQPVFFGTAALIAAGNPVRVSQRRNFLLWRQVGSGSCFGRCGRRCGCGRTRFARRGCAFAACRRSCCGRHHQIGLGLASFCHRIILPKLWRTPYQFFLSVRSQVCCNAQIRAGAARRCYRAHGTKWRSAMPREPITLTIHSHLHVLSFVPLNRHAVSRRCGSAPPPSST